MDESRMLQDIDIAHQVGIKVFAIDAGWFSKMGDWTVDLKRFPRGWVPIRQTLIEYGRKLGLWLTSKASVSSKM